MADQGEGPGGPGPPLFFDQNEARRAEKNFFADRAPPYLRVWFSKLEVAQNLHSWEYVTICERFGLLNISKNLPHVKYFNTYISPQPIEFRFLSAD